MADLKLIEDHLKYLLFKTAPGIPPPVGLPEVGPSHTGPPALGSDHHNTIPFQQLELPNRSNAHPSSSHIMNNYPGDYARQTKLPTNHFEGDSNVRNSNYCGNDISHQFNDAVLSQRSRRPPHPEYNPLVQSGSVEDGFYREGNQEAPFSPDFISTLLKEPEEQNKRPSRPTGADVPQDGMPEHDATDKDYNKRKKKRNSLRRKEKKMAKRVNRRERRYTGDADDGKKSMLNPVAISKAKSSSTRNDEDVLKPEDIAIPFKTDVSPNDIREYIMQKSRQCKWTFYCEVCEYNTAVESAMAKHVISQHHRRKMEQAEEDLLLRYLPEPLAGQVMVVDELVRRHSALFGLSDQNLLERRYIAERVNHLVSTYLPGCSIEAIGSSVTGLGLRNSNVDLVLKVPPKVNAADMLAATYSLLLKDPASKEVSSEFGEKIPRIKFADVDRNLKCEIILDTGNCSQLTKLLLFYVSLDPRVAILGKVFRFWADICDIDKTEKGTLPSFCYSLLLVHYLQQENPPVLPAIPENTQFLEAPDVETFRTMFNWHSENQSCVGLLWIKLMHFYAIKYQPGKDVVSIRTSKKVTCKDKNWGTRFIAIEDPFIQRNLAHVIPNRSIFRYMQDCFINTYRHFGYPRLKGIGQLKLSARDTPCSSRLNYSSAYDTSTTVSGIADGLSESTDIMDDNNSLSAFDLLEDNDPDLPMDSVISTIGRMVLDDSKAGEASMDRTVEAGGIGNLGATRSSSVSSRVSSTRSEGSPSYRAENKEVPGVASERQSEVGSKRPMYYWDDGDGEITEDMLTYEFTASVFAGDKALPLVCHICQKNGHLKDECPSEALPPIIKLPPMTQDFLSILGEVCYQIRSENQPSEAELRDREMDRLFLQEYIRRIYEDAELQLFGSFRNGFGFTKSDMDFCLTFHNNSGKELDQCQIIETLAEQLSHCERFVNVIPIVSAKVPIVKFLDRMSGLEGDISLYNTLAQHNTRMLDAYCQIDERVQILGYMFKYFAKTLDICDASRGSLSSYAYILMTIFFLQQRKPPVIPVLQELYIGEMPVVSVDGWNAWFFDDIKRLREIWPEYGKNREPVGQLWLGLLSFYASEFNLKDCVISIKQKKLLSRFRKLWNSKKIAIEDPFDLNHNLGSGLSRKMNNYIMRAFIRGREHFGTPKNTEYLYQISPKGPRAYLFDRHMLNKGQEPPKDRGCRYCGKIGHLIRDCPARIQSPKRKRMNDKNKFGEPERQNAAKNAPIGRPNIQPNSRISPKKTPPQNIQSSVPVVERTPPGFAPNMPPQHFPSPPPGFQNTVGQPHGASPNSMAHFLLQQPQQPYKTRPMTSHPFPVTPRSGEAYYVSSSHNSQQITVEYQATHWQQQQVSPPMDNFMPSNPWPRMPQLPLSRAQLLTNNLPQQPLRSFVTINAPLPPSYQQLSIPPERPRNSPDPGQFYQQFSANW